VLIFYLPLLLSRSCPVTVLSGNRPRTLALRVRTDQDLKETAKQ